MPVTQIHLDSLTSIVSLCGDIVPVAPATAIIRLDIAYWEMKGGFADVTATASLYWELRTDHRGTISFISAVDHAVLADESPIRVFKLKDFGRGWHSVSNQLGPN